MPAIEIHYTAGYALNTINYNGITLVQGDLGSKKFEFHFAHIDSENITDYECRVVIQRPDGSSSNELYVTPNMNGYFTLTVSDWMTEQDGEIDITTILKIDDTVAGNGLASLVVNPSADPNPTTIDIDQAQYDAILSAINENGDSIVSIQLKDVEQDGRLDGLDGSKSDVGHTHVEADISDLDKYTQTEVDGLLANKSDVGHTHVEANISDLDKYTQTEVDGLLDDKLDKITHQSHLDDFNNPHQVTAEQIDAVPITKLGGTVEGNIPLLDNEGLIAPQFLGERYNDVYVGYGVFDDPNADTPILQELYPPNQWDLGQDEPIVGATPFDKKSNTIYITKNVKVNTAWRYSELSNEFLVIQPTPLALGTTAGTAYEGSAGQANRDDIDDILSGEKIVGKASALAELNNVEDVTITSPTARQALMYNESEGEWQNKNVTKTDVGLSNVENYAVASQAEAEAGTANDKYMTPKRVSQATIDGGEF